MGFVKKVVSTEGNFISRRQALSLMRLHASAILFGGSLHSTSTAYALDLPAQSLAVTTVNHLSYASQNYKLTRDFYVDFLGMRDVWDDGSKCQLDFGSIESPNSFYMTGAKPSAEPTIAHYGFGLPNYWNVVNQLKEDLLKRPLQGVHPDGEAGWFLNGPSGFVQHIVAAKDPAMFPGAAAFCDIARSKECKDAFALGVQNLNATPKPSPQSFKPLYFDYMMIIKEAYGKGILTFTLNILRFPSFQSPVVLPKSFKKSAIADLNKWFAKNGESALLHDMEREHVIRLIQYLENNETPHAGASDLATLQSDFKKFYTQYDARRDKDFEKTFPKLKEWYNDL